MRVVTLGVSSVTVAHDAVGFVITPLTIVPPIIDAAFTKDSLREMTVESLGTENPFAIRGAAVRTVVRVKKRPMFGLVGYGPCNSYLAKTKRGLDQNVRARERGRGGERKKEKKERRKPHR